MTEPHPHRRTPEECSLAVEGLERNNLVVWTLRVARFAGIAMDELLAGQWLSTRVCPHCGHPPEDFTDEETVVE